MLRKGKTDLFDFVVFAKAKTLFNQALGSDPRIAVRGRFRRETGDLPVLVPFRVCWLSRMAIHDGLSLSQN